MKFDRCNIRHLRCQRTAAFIGLLSLLAGGWCAAAAAPETGLNPSQSTARTLAFRTMERLANGDAFDAKLRQRIWAGGREVVGVGHYEQSGGGTGRYSLEMTIHDGDSRQTMKQISDGRLAWNRSQIGTAISVRRIDLGRIDEHEQEMFAAARLKPKTEAPSPGDRFVTTPTAHGERLSARLLAGGLVELLDRINNDYDLRLGRGTVEGQAVWILRGSLRAEERSRIEKASGRDEIASLCPVEVRVAIAASGDANGFGAGLPIRFEFWSAPQLVPPSPGSASQAARTDRSHPTALPANKAGDLPASDTSTAAAASSSRPIPSNEVPPNEVPPNEVPSNEVPSNEVPSGRLISMLEIYAMRRIEPSPEERFRFISDDREVTFLNDTSRYLDQLEKP